MSEEEFKKQTKKYADEESDLKLNPNQAIVDAIVKGLARNKEKYGYAYCPCRPITGDEEEDKKIICPCVYHKDEIKKDGHCHCRLFVKED
ncbi:ferredoxin:thioredoxin reductase [Candidatus Woesearchaeota archaeon]|nr:ferredoxin:thioredoxin reductase [Candidatus Woesearchaeota archaeon]